MNKKRIIISIALVIVVILSSTLAYFSDKAGVSLTGESGSICLRHVSSRADLNNILPGEPRHLEYSYINDGTLEIDTRITYIVNYGDINSSGEFTPGNHEGETVVAKLTDGEQLILNNENNASMTLAGPTLSPGDRLERTAEFKLDEHLGNWAQRMNVEIQVIIEGKQASAVGWNEINTQTLTIHNNDYNVVKSSACNSNNIDYSEYFRYVKNEDGYSIKGFIKNIESTLEADGVDLSFRYNPVIPSMYKGERVTEIANDAFWNKELDSVVIPDTIKSIGRYAFDSNKLTSVKIPSSVVRVDKYAFSGNKLKSVSIPNSVEILGEGVFWMNELTEVELSNSIKSIEMMSFAENELSSIDIPDSVTLVDAFAFRGNKLTSITIPDSVETIGYNAFIDNPGGIVNANLLANDNWPIVRGYSFNDTWLHKALQ